MIAPPPGGVTIQWCDAAPMACRDNPGGEPEHSSTKYLPPLGMEISLSWEMPFVMFCTWDEAPATVIPCEHGAFFGLVETCGELCP